MAKFNLKEHIAKNKATFFGSLTEGQFSWFTQDTNQQIGSERFNTLPFVYMHDDKGNKWLEKNYEGYGEFGGKDYYELLDQMNGGIGDRNEGIRKAFDEPAVAAGEIKFPALTISATLPSGHDFTKEAKHDPNQSWYTPGGDYDDTDYFRDEDLDEGYMGQFYAPEYLEKKYGKEMAKKIEAEIDEMDENSWDRFTGIESAEEVDEYISDIIDMLKEGYDEFKRADKGSKDVTAKDKGEEEVYGAGVKKGEEIEKKKMTKEEFKAKIKEMVLAEINLDVDKMEDAPESEVDFLAELEGMLNEAEGLTPLQDYVYQYEIEISGEDQAQEYLDDIKKLNTPDDVYDYYAYGRDWQGSMDDDLENIYRQVKRKFKNLSEADETEKDTAETDTTDVTVDDTETVDTTTTTEVDPNVKAVQDALTQAQAAAQALGDKKLMDQIGNTITFFTREHVVEKPKGAVAESMFPMLKKILK